MIVNPTTTNGRSSARAQPKTTSFRKTRRAREYYHCTVCRPAKRRERAQGQGPPNQQQGPPNQQQGPPNQQQGPPNQQQPAVQSFAAQQPGQPQDAQPQPAQAEQGPPQPQAQPQAQAEQARARLPSTLPLVATPCM